MGLLLDRWLHLPPRTNGFVRDADSNVRMRDGVGLVTAVYRAQGVAHAPTVLVRSPYGRGRSLTALAQAFATRGYHCVLQSCRGTFGSGGAFRPFVNERADGLDTVAWIEAQPWYAGKLGLHGGSYLGMVQWAIAAELGTRVSALTAAVTVSDFPRALHDGGGFRLEDFLTWVAQLQAQEKHNLAWLALKRALLGDPLARRYAELPVATIDEKVFGRELDFWREWAENDPTDPRWNAIRFTDSIDRITAPVSLLAGWSDIFCTIELEDFQKLRAAGNRSRLTIGPWTHASLALIGASLRDALEWFDWHLRGVSPAKRHELTRLRYWVNGVEQWRDSQSWPPTPSISKPLWLAPDGSLNAAIPISGTRTFIYDPANPTPSITGARLSHPKGRADVRSLSDRKDVLTFDAAPLDRDIEIIGDVNVTLTTSANADYHDLFVCLCDVDEQGVAINIVDSYQRLRAPAEGESIRTTTLQSSPTAWRIARGHHLRLLVAAGAFPRFARNLGVSPRGHEGTTLQPVEITLHCGDAVTSMVRFDAQEL